MSKADISEVFLVWMDDLELLNDDGAYIEQGMIHSEEYGLSVDVPEYKTRRLKWVDSNKGPVPNGSEYVIAKTPNDPNDSDKFRYNLHIVFSEEQAGETKNQIEAAKRVNMIQNIIMLFCGCAAVYAFFIQPNLNPAARTDVVNPQTVASAPVDSASNIVYSQEYHDVMYHYQNTEKSGMPQMYIIYDDSGTLKTCWHPCDEAYDVPFP